MLAYAAHRRRIAERHSAPHVMLLIIAGHVALIAAVMSARMDRPGPIASPPTEVELIEMPKPPPKPRPVPPEPTPFDVDRVRPIVPMPQPNDDLVAPTPVPLPVPGGDAIIPNPGPRPGPAPTPAVVRRGPRFATPAADVRPPYPPSKIASEEEAVLKLRLSIDPRGRVVAVEPVGGADPAFLAAARRHLLAHWRYKPATEDGRAIGSATVVTLRFQLDG